MAGALSPPGPPTAERRLVSVLFADLVGFTALSESRDPEETRDLLSRYFDACRKLIARYGGTVEKFIGDAVMAVWGTPVAQEDDAERAVRTALDLTRAVEQLGVDADIPGLRARAGVLTGEAAVTLGAEGEGMVAGDLVNTASRIQAEAPPGAVYVGEATRRATEPAIAYAPAGDHHLKGKQEPVTLFHALRVIGGRGGALRSEGLEAPFVGRERELEQLKTLFHTAAEQRRAHLLSVVGIAGIGKSRLSWEFFKYLDGLAETAWWHRGRCLAYGEGVTYWALAEMIRGRAGIAEGDPPEESLGKLRATLEQHFPDLDERVWAEPRLASLLGLGEGRRADAPVQDAEDLFSAWRIFFERLADQFPTVLLFEDLQWADPSLLDFVDYLTTWSRNHPLFVLALARPELLERRPDWGAGKRATTQMYLEPLSGDEMQELLSGLVPELPPTLREKILARAEGVPLYAMETVRMLLDRGLLAQEGSSYRLTDAAASIDDLEVPETLHALIAARLDGLPAEERRALQDAAVLGKTFTRSALAAVSGSSPESLEPVLTSLVRKEILFVQADARSPERGQYGFLQDLVRLVAYETLAVKERKARHLAAATFLESIWGEDDLEFVEVVASHLLDAYRAQPQARDAGEIKARAREALTQAGLRAESLVAGPQAFRYFSQALELADDPRTRAELQERTGVAAFLASRFESFGPLLDEAIESFKALGDERAAARVTARLADVAFGNGRFEEARARMQDAYDVLSREAPDETLATVASQLARVLLFSGRTQEALDRLEDALAIAEGLGLTEVLVEALDTKAIAMWNRGRPVESEILLSNALRISLDHHLYRAAARAYNNLTSCLEAADRLQEALDLATQGAELSAKVGRGWGLKFLAGTLTFLTAMGRWDEALARSAEVEAEEGGRGFQLIEVELLPRVFIHVHRGDMDQALRDLERFADAGDSEEMQTASSYLHMQAVVARAEGRLREAGALAEAAIERCRPLGVTSSLLKQSLVEAIEAYLGMGELDQAEKLLRSIDEIPQGLLSPVYRFHRFRLGARLTSLRGQAQGVESGFEAAANEARAIPMPFWLGVTLLEHAEWLTEQGRRDDALPLEAEARGLFAELKARPWLDRLGDLGRHGSSSRLTAGTSPA